MKFPFRFSGLHPAKHWPLMAFALLSFVLLNGCQDPPEACFRVDATVVDQNEELTFQNCSQFQQEGYEWDFGDGSTSNAVSAIHRFATRGTFLVNLVSKATNEINNDSYSEIIKVGNRILRSAEVTNFPATAPGGGGWDVADGPDLALLFLNGSSIEYQTPVQNDATSGQTISFNLVSGNFDLTPDNWTIILADMDGATDYDTLGIFSQDFSLFEPNAQKEIRNQTTDISWTIAYDVN